VSPVPYAYLMHLVQCFETIENFVYSHFLFMLATSRHYVYCFIQLRPIDFGPKLIKIELVVADDDNGGVAVAISNVDVMPKGAAKRGPIA